MSDELRRALAEAAGDPPPVPDWLTPVRAGVRRRRARRAVATAAGTSALVVAGVLAGLTLLPAPEPAEVLLPPPTPTARPTASPVPSPQRTAAPTVLPSPPAPGQDGLGPLPSASAQAPRLPGDRGRTAPPRPAATPGGRPAAAATGAPPAAAPARPSPRPSASPSPSPVPTAGAQDITLSWTPQERSLPAGQQVEVVVTARGSAERPAFVQALRVDGEPVEQDAPRTCTSPTARPERRPQETVRRFTLVLSPGEHVLEAVADDDCSWYRGRARASWTVTAS